MSEMCVSATARSALQRGIAVVLAHDAHATYDIPAMPGIARYTCRNRRQSCRLGARRPARAARDQLGHHVRHRWTTGRTLAHAAALAAARISAPNRHSRTANLLVTVSTQSRDPNREPTQVCGGIGIRGHLSLARSGRSLRPAVNALKAIWEDRECSGKARPCRRGSVCSPPAGSPAAAPAPGTFEGSLNDLLPGPAGPGLPTQRTSSPPRGARCAAAFMVRSGRFSAARLIALVS
jgi:Isochorismatase family